MPWKNTLQPKSWRAIAEQFSRIATHQIWSTIKDGVNIILMLSETFVSLPYNKLFHFDIFVKQKQKAYSCFSLLNQWKNLCQLIAWILSNSNCL